MLKVAVDDPDTSERASPIVFVPKITGSFRCCIEYCDLNALADKDSYPILKIDECIRFRGEAKIFSTLDVNSG